MKYPGVGAGEQYLIEALDPIEVYCNRHGAMPTQPCFFLIGRTVCEDRIARVSGGWQSIEWHGSCGIYVEQCCSDGIPLKTHGFYDSLRCAREAYPRTRLGDSMSELLGG